MNYLLKNKLTDVGDPFEGEQQSNKPINTNDDCPQTHRHTDHQTHRPTDHQDTPPPLFSLYESDINKHIPTEPHDNNRCMFKVSQVLKTVERDNNRKLKQDEIRQIFDYWASRACHHFRPELTYEDYFAEFWRIFDATKSCHDESPLKEAFERAKQAPLPPGHERIESDEIKLLASFCYQLSLITGGTFFITAEDAAKFFAEVGTRQMNTRLVYLAREQIGVLKRLEKGRTGKASVYEYIGTEQPPKHQNSKTEEP